MRPRQRTAELITLLKDAKQSRECLSFLKHAAILKMSEVAINKKCSCSFTRPLSAFEIHNASKDKHRRNTG